LQLFLQQDFCLQRLPQRHLSSKLEHSALWQKRLSEEGESCSLASGKTALVTFMSDSFGKVPWSLIKSSVDKFTGN